MAVLAVEAMPFPAPTNHGAITDPLVGDLGQQCIRLLDPCDGVQHVQRGDQSVSRRGERRLNVHQRQESAMKEWLVVVAPTNIFFDTVGFQASRQINLHRRN